MTPLRQQPVDTSKLDVALLGKSALIRVPEQLTSQQAGDFAEASRQFIEAAQVAYVVLDFSQTVFLDSAGLGALLRIHKAARVAGSEISFWSVSKALRPLMRLTSLGRVFEVRREMESVHGIRESKPWQNPYVYCHPSVRSRFKRLIDVTGALVGLLVTAVLFIPIAIAIKLESQGPILCSHARSGWMGRPFRLWRFRTTTSERKSGDKAFIPEVTKVGNFLRKTSLEAMPQFWNVLKGEMSLVGTRPPTAEEVERYNVPQWRKLDVRPGITGEWQVSKKSAEQQVEDAIKLDLAYQRNWSLKYDMQLLIKTILGLLDKMR
jgi:anti-anti-sigma factor